MPKKGDDLESITSIIAIDHLKNAVIIGVDLVETDCIFADPTQTGQLGKAGGVELDLAQPVAIVLDGDVAGIVWPVTIEGVAYSLDGQPKPDGNGLTQLLLVEGQVTQPAVSTFL